MPEHTAESGLHTRTSTEHGPDFCAECSDAAQEWVTWPCPSAENDAANCPRCGHPNLDHYRGFCHHPAGVAMCGCRVIPPAMGQEEQ